MVCNKCGAQMSDTAKFCNRCGEAIGEKAVRKKTKKKASKIPRVINIVVLSLNMVLIIAGLMVMKSTEQSAESVPTVKQGEYNMILNLGYLYNDSDMTATVVRINGFEIMIPSEVEADGKVYTVTSIDENVFSKEKYLQSIIIPNSVKEIGNHAFAHCGQLKSVYIPSSVKEIGDNAFESCPNLQSVTISEGVNIIGNHAFRYCTDLESVTIPESVTDLGVDVFYGCDKLTE